MPPGTSGADTGSGATSHDGAPPQIDAARLRIALSRLARTVRRRNRSGLTPTQLSALATVDQSGPLRLGDLAAAEGIAPSTLTRLVTALEESGYVERRAVPGDARASMLSITPGGRAVIERVREESTMMLAGMLAQLTPAQRAAIAASLPALEHLAGADNAS
jgi:DNA-binding MarR family transcriptional regulator